MVKDAKITSKQFIDFVLKNIAAEVSDSIFERQFDLVYGAIHTYTPIPYRQDLSNKVFDVLLKLIQTTPADQSNRIVILKSKLPLFATSDENKKSLIHWREGKFELLKAHPTTVGQ